MYFSVIAKEKSIFDCKGKGATLSQWDHKWGSTKKKKKKNGDHAFAKEDVFLSLKITNP